MLSYIKLRSRRARRHARRVQQFQVACLLANVETLERRELLTVVDAIADALDLTSVVEAIVAMPVLTRLVDLSAAIPGGVGKFTDLGAPAIEKGVLAFSGSGSNGLQGIYTLSDGTLKMVADTNTLMPGWNRNFTDLAGPVLDKGTVTFQGFENYPSQIGIYANGGGALSAIARCNTARPNGNVFGNMGVGNADEGFVSIIGCTWGATDSLYLFDGQQLMTIADRSLVLPESTQSLELMGSAVNDGSDVAFTARTYANDSNPVGVYLRLKGQMQKVADFQTAIPGGNGNFTGFGSALGLEKGRVLFDGTGANNQHGLFDLEKGTLRAIAQIGGAVPGTTLTYSDFGDVLSMDGDVVMFTATLSDGAHAILVEDRGTLSILVSSSQPLDGQRVRNFEIGPDGLSGRSAAFKANFADGTAALYRADLPRIANPMSGGVRL